MPQVSVVVPIYKVEKYLRQCVDSILGQTLTDIEVILVDDGSPDSCPAIVDEYAAADSRVIAIHQPNGGYGKAVNTGIARATAPYIGIIESDDWIEPTMYEKLYTRAQETGADVVKCMFWKYDSTLPAGKQDELWQTSTHNLLNAPDTPFSPTDWDPIFFFHASLWSNLYRAEFLKQIPFIETQGAAYQDFPFIMEVYTRAGSMSVLKEPLLHYRMEAQQGSSSTSDGPGLMRMADMTAAARDVLISHNILEKVKEAFYFHAYMANIGYLSSIQAEYRQEYFNKVHSILAPLLNDPSFTWKYFSRKHRRRAKNIALGGDEACLHRHWQFSYKKGKWIIYFAGYKLVPCFRIPARICNYLQSFARVVKEKKTNVSQ